MVSIETAVCVAPLSLGNGESLLLTATQWKSGGVPHYSWVGAEVQTPHMVSIDNTEGGEQGRPCYQMVRVRVLASYLTVSDTSPMGMLGKFMTAS